MMGKQMQAKTNETNISSSSLLRPVAWSIIWSSGEPFFCRLLPVSLSNSATNSGVLIAFNTMSSKDTSNS